MDGSKKICGYKSQLHHSLLLKHVHKSMTGNTNKTQSNSKNSNTALA